MCGEDLQNFSFVNCNLTICVLQIYNVLNILKTPKAFMAQKRKVTKSRSCNCRQGANCISRLPCYVFCFVCWQMNIRNTNQSNQTGKWWWWSDHLVRNLTKWWSKLDREDEDAWGRGRGWRRQHYCLAICQCFGKSKSDDETSKLVTSHYFFTKSGTLHCLYF